MVANSAANSVASTVAGAAASMLSAGRQPELPGFLNSLGGPLGHYGLWAVALLVLVEDFGIPVPGETVLIAAAIYAGSGRLNVVAVGLVGFAAAVAGDNIGYAIGRFGGRAVVERWGKYVFITPERLDKAEAFFNKHGGKIITIARFVEGLRQANGLIAGITEMHWLKFVAYNALGAALWVGTWVSVGYFAGQHIGTIYHDVSNYTLYAVIVAVVLIAIWVFLRVRRHRRGKAAMRKTEPAQSETEPAQGKTEPAQGETEPTQGETGLAPGETGPSQRETGPAQAKTVPTQGEAGPDTGEAGQAAGAARPTMHETSTGTGPGSAAANGSGPHRSADETLVDKQPDGAERAAAPEGSGDPGRPGGAGRSGDPAGSDRRGAERGGADQGGTGA
jgi:membrane protein DedA with SNARE-associated domain